MAWNKYKVEKKQIYSGGTWVDSVPLDTRVGDYVATYGTYAECSGDYSRDYFTIHVIDNTDLKFIGINDGQGCNTSVSYSIDGGNSWSYLYTNQPVSFSAGTTIILKDSDIPTNFAFGYFNSTGRISVEGNIMSLLYGDDFVGKTNISGRSKTFGYMFRECTGLVSAEGLVLPATTLHSYCYDSMFYGCTNLTKAPKILPATTLTEACYLSMFLGCTSLTTAPEIMATTTAKECCYLMFKNCTSLANAPELNTTDLSELSFASMFEGCSSLITAPTKIQAPSASRLSCNQMFNGCSALTTSPDIYVTTLGDNSFNSMFNGCTSLNHIKMMATDLGNNNSLYNWVNGVSPTGTFIKNANATWTDTGVSGIPNGWTVQTASS